MAAQCYFPTSLVKGCQGNLTAHAPTAVRLNVFIPDLGTPELGISTFRGNSTNAQEPSVYIPFAPELGLARRVYVKTWGHQIGDPKSFLLVSSTFLLVSSSSYSVSSNYIWVSRSIKKYQEISLDRVAFRTHIHPPLPNHAMAALRSPRHRHFTTTLATATLRGHQPCYLHSRRHNVPTTCKGVCLSTPSRSSMAVGQ